MNKDIMKMTSKSSNNQLMPDATNGNHFIPVFACYMQVLGYTRILCTGKQRKKINV